MDIHVASQCLSDRIFDSTGTETLNSTNDFFISHEYKASPKTQDYRTKAEALYRASFYNCNFVNKPDRALKRVNGIVETKSNGLIKELFSPGDINNETKLIIVNTIAFKSNWLHQFDKTKTSYDVFYVDRVTEQLVQNLLLFMCFFRLSNYRLRIFNRVAIRKMNRERCNKIFLIVVNSVRYNL